MSLYIPHVARTYSFHDPLHTACGKKPPFPWAFIYRMWQEPTVSMILYIPHVARNPHFHDPLHNACSKNPQFPWSLRRPVVSFHIDVVWYSGVSCFSFSQVCFLLFILTVFAEEPYEQASKKVDKRGLLGLGYGYGHGLAYVPAVVSTPAVSYTKASSH